MHDFIFAFTILAKNFEPASPRPLARGDHGPWKKSEIPELAPPVMSLTVRSMHTGGAATYSGCLRPGPTKSPTSRFPGEGGRSAAWRRPCVKSGPAGAPGIGLMTSPGINSSRATCAWSNRHCKPKNLSIAVSTIAKLPRKYKRSARSGPFSFQKLQRSYLRVPSPIFLARSDRARA